MFGLPKSFDFSIFVGKTLERVCFTENTLDLFFGDYLYVSVESSIAVKFDLRNPDEKMKIPVQQSSLMRLLARSVNSAEAENNSTLVLYFEGGAVVKCFDDSEHYESYRITYHDQHTIV